jgi:hypothetical protein
VYEDEAGCTTVAMWLPGCCLGMVLGLWAGDALARWRFPPPEQFHGLFAPLGPGLHAVLHVPIVLAGGAVGLGAAQALVLLPLLRPPRWPWALASLTVPVVMLLSASFPADPLGPFVGVVLLFPGLGMGLGQYLVLARGGAGAGWWVPASAVAWPASIAAAFLVVDAAGAALAGVVAGLVYAAITGAALLFLVDRVR